MKLSEYIKKYGDKKVDVEKLDKFIIEDKVWIPEEGDLMYYLNKFGDINYRRYDSYNTLVIKILGFQKVFKTRAEAEFEAKKRKFLLFMERQFIKNSDEIDWEDESQEKYFIYFNNYNNLIDIGGHFAGQQSKLYTTDRKWLEGFIEKYEEGIKSITLKYKEQKEREYNG